MVSLSFLCGPCYCHPLLVFSDCSFVLGPLLSFGSSKYLHVHWFVEQYLLAEICGGLFASVWTTGSREGLCSVPSLPQSSFWVICVMI